MFLRSLLALGLLGVGSLHCFGSEPAELPASNSRAAEKTPPPIAPLRLAEAATDFDLLHVLRAVLRPPEDAGVCVVVSQDLVNAFFAAPINDNYTVGTYIVGTYVSGEAQSLCKADWRLRSNPQALDVEIVIDGRSDSKTIGGAGPVNVHTATAADFVATKHLLVTSDGIHARPTEVALGRLDTAARVSSPLPGIVGRIATNIGQDVVNRKQPQVDVESRAHLHQRIGTNIDQRVNGAVERLHGLLRQAGLDKSSLFGRELQLQTTDKLLAISTGAAPPAVWNDLEPLAEHEVTVIVSKSLVEHIRSLAPRVQLAKREVRTADASFENERPRQWLERLRPSARQWSDDGQWLTLRWSIDTQRVAWLVQSTDRLQQWLDVEQAPTPDPRPANVQAASSRDGTYFPFEKQ